MSISKKFLEGLLIEQKPSKEELLKRFGDKKAEPFKKNDDDEKEDEEI